jgi:hypothetical protein
VPIFVPLVDQQVDIFTKSLLDPAFTNLMACISIGAFPLKGPLEVIFGVKVAYGVHHYEILCTKDGSHGFDHVHGRKISALVLNESYRV